MASPVTIDTTENLSLGAADSGTTIRFMNQYTAMPYRMPEMTACSTRKLSFGLAAKKTADAEPATRKCDRRPGPALAKPPLDEAGPSQPEAMNCRTLIGLAPRSPLFTKAAVRSSTPQSRP